MRCYALTLDGRLELRGKWDDALSNWFERDPIAGLK
jgi:hypothetical protein